MSEPVLEVRGLEVSFDTPAGTVHAVRGLDFTLTRGETLAIVGESGSGKSQAMLAATGLLADNGYARGSVRLLRQELLGLPRHELDRVRGARIAMVFQDPSTALNPYLRIRTQLVEVLTRHMGMDAGAARRRALALLDAVRIPDAARRLDEYPHQLSGGMRQRVMLAIALACDPAVLVADEPTTALDVTVQAQVLDLLDELRRATDTAVVLITHDLGIVAGRCDTMLVMRHGVVVERGTVDAVFAAPAHEYTAGLIAAVPRLDRPAAVRA